MFQYKLCYVILGFYSVYRFLESPTTDLIWYGILQGYYRWIVLGYMIFCLWFWFSYRIYGISYARPNRILKSWMVLEIRIRIIVIIIGFVFLIRKYKILIGNLLGLLCPNRNLKSYRTMVFPIGGDFRPPMLALLLYCLIANCLA